MCVGVCVIWKASVQAFVHHIFSVPLLSHSQLIMWKLKPYTMCFVDNCGCRLYIMLYIDAVLFSPSALHAVVLPVVVYIACSSVACCGVHWRVISDVCACLCMPGMYTWCVCLVCVAWCVCLVCVPEACVCGHLWCVMLEVGALALRAYNIVSKLKEAYLVPPLLAP